MNDTNNVTTFSTAEARDNLSEIINRAAFGQERIVLTRHGKALVAVIPIQDLTELEKLEDEIDRAEVLLSLESARTEGTTSWESVKAELGLE